MPNYYKMIDLDGYELTERGIDRLLARAWIEAIIVAGSDIDARYTAYWDRTQSLLTKYRVEVDTSRLSTAFARLARDNEGAITAIELDVAIQRLSQSED